MALSPSLAASVDALGSRFADAMMRAAIARVRALGIADAVVLAEAEAITGMLREAARERLGVVLADAKVALAMSPALAGASIMADASLVGIEVANRWAASRAA